MRGMYLIQKQMQQVQQVTPQRLHERGDIVTDADGSTWRIVGWDSANGQYDYSRIRVGSLADATIRR